jgi:hypothetical protein
MRPWLLLPLGLLALLASAADPASPEAPEAEPALGPATVKAALAAFADVAAVLQHPRCMNCHPAGDVPLQGDESRPHALQVTRFSPDVGLPCSTCHRETGLDQPHLPPANPHWSMPPANQVFEGRSVQQLCLQLRDPARTGGRDLAALLEHVEHDSLVLYGWSPGLGLSVPELSHEGFVARFRTWVEAGAPCGITDDTHR